MAHNVRAPFDQRQRLPARPFGSDARPEGNAADPAGLEIVDVDADRNLLLIKGSVPGGRNAVVEVRTDG
jgi:large subunit ribosomal protein L3